jgi:HK97 family phage major capsid protein
MAKRKIDKLTEALAALEAKAEELKTRESELETAIAEADTEEEQTAVSEEVTAHETATTENNAAIEEARAAIEAAKAELAEIEKNTPAPAAPVPADTTREVNTMPIMTRRFIDYNEQERGAFVAREEVKSFLDQVRTAMKTRAITGGELTIPTIMLPLIHAEAEKSSKLLRHVRVVNVSGNARQTIMGDVPEGVWTEMCGKINEGGITFTDVEVDGYKIGVFVPVCNALLEDNDVNLASELISAMGQGIGYGLDKAIVFGTGTKMPTGMANGITVKTNLGSVTGAKLFAAILTAAASAKHERGDLVWIMNKATRLKLVAEAMSFNAAGAIVTGVNNTMPVVGGEIVEEDFVKDNEIIVGYGQRYLLARRAGTTVKTSEHARFIEDQTVFKATARYDGKPVFADAFIALGLGAAPTAQLDANHPFPADTANAAAVNDGD